MSPMSGFDGVNHETLFETAAANAGYETANSGAGDSTKCLAFIEAVNTLLIVVPMRMSQGGLNRQNLTEFDLPVWERRLDAARSWYAANRQETNAASSSVRHLGIGSWR